VAETECEHQITPESFHQNNLNGFLRQVFQYGTLGAENAHRLQQLSENISTPLLEDGVINQLQLVREEGVPVAQGLRTLHDFSHEQVVILKTPGMSTFEEKVIIGGVYDHLCVTQLNATPASIQTYIDPQYPGLFSKTDYDHYKHQKLGSGHGMSSGYMNTELTRLLSYCGIGTEPDDHLAWLIKRHFQVNVRSYRATGTKNF
jgi:hypothetical protein